MKNTKVTLYSLILILALSACSSPKSTDSKEVTAPDSTEISTEAEAPPVNENAESEKADPEAEDRPNDENSLPPAEAAAALDDMAPVSIDSFDSKKLKSISQDDGIEEPIYYGNQEVLGSEFGTGTYKYDLEQGKEVWKNRSHGTLGADSRLIDGELYISSGDTIEVFTPDKGSVIRTYTLPPQTVPEYLFVYDEIVLAVKMNADNTNMYAFDRKGTKLLWEKTIQAPSEYFRERYDIPSADGLLLLEDQTKDIYALDINTGDEKWRIPAPEAWGGNANTDGSSLYILKDKSSFGDLTKASIQKVNLGTQETEKELEIVWEITGLYAPLITKEAIFYKDKADGDLIALSTGLDRELWRLNLGNKYRIKSLMKDEGMLYAVMDYSPDGTAVEAVHLAVINTVTGKPVDHIQLTESMANVNRTYIAEGKVYVQINNEKYFIYDPDDVNRPFSLK